MKKKLLILFCFNFSFFLIIKFLVPKNTPIIADVFNKNSLEIKVDKNIENKDIKINLTIQETKYKDIEILNNGSTFDIPKGYGENDFILSYKDEYIAKFRHFKTNNWHDNHYYFNFYGQENEIKCEFEIIGPDSLSIRTIILNNIMTNKK